MAIKSGKICQPTAVRQMDGTDDELKKLVFEYCYSYKQPQAC